MITLLKLLAVAAVWFWISVRVGVGIGRIASGETHR